MYRIIWKTVRPVLQHDLEYKAIFDFVKSYVMQRCFPDYTVNDKTEFFLKNNFQKIFK